MGTPVKALGLLGRIDLPGEAASVPKARRYLRMLLAATGHPQIDDAVLLVSELVTNALRHSDSGRPDKQVTVAVAQHHGTIHIDVIDAGSDDDMPRPRTDLDETDCSGRGLWLVRELATAWGWYESEPGRVVWFQLAAPDLPGSALAFLAAAGGAGGPGGDEAEGVAGGPAERVGHLFA